MYASNKTSSLGLCVSVLESKKTMPLVERIGESRRLLRYAVNRGLCHGL